MDQIGHYVFIKNYLFFRQNELNHRYSDIQSPSKFAGEKSSVHDPKKWSFIQSMTSIFMGPITHTTQILSTFLLVF